MIAEARPAHFMLMNAASFPLGDGYSHRTNPEDGVVHLRQALLLLAELTDATTSEWCRAAEKEAANHAGQSGTARDICDSMRELLAQRLEELWSGASGRQLADALRDGLKWLDHQQRGALLRALGPRLVPRDVVSLGAGLDPTTALGLIERLTVNPGPDVSEALGTLLTAEGQGQLSEHLCQALKTHGTPETIATLAAALSGDTLPRSAQRHYGAVKELLETRFGLGPGGLTISNAAAEASDSAAGGLSEAGDLRAAGELSVAPSDRVAIEAEVASQALAEAESLEA